MLLVWYQLMTHVLKEIVSPVLVSLSTAKEYIYIDGKAKIVVRFC